MRKIFFLIISVVGIIAAVEGGLRVFSKDQFKFDLNVVLNPGQIPESTKFSNTEMEFEDLVRRCLTTIKKRPKVPHPYFGYVYNSVTTPGANKDGFLDATDFSTVSRAEKDTFNIGVFGGSVAANFALDQNRKILAGQASIIDEFRKQLPKIFDHGKIRLLNFAIDGHKQPQQYFISSYFAEKIDLAITIDGYNEIGYAPLDEFPTDYPGLSALFFSKDSLRNNYLTHLNELLQNQLDATLIVAKSRLLRGSYLVGHLWSVYNRHVQRQITHAHSQYRSSLDREHPYQTRKYSDQEHLETMAEIWRKYSLLQDRLFAVQRIPHFHFLQPNQYVKGSKKLSHDEVELFFNSERAEWIDFGYRKLLEKRNDLKLSGVEVFDLTKVFLNISDTVYSDSCCHLNSRGEEIMSEAISGRVVQFYLNKKR